jgi:hypothetical protein
VNQFPDRHVCGCFLSDDEYYDHRGPCDECNCTYLSRIRAEVDAFEREFALKRLHWPDRIEGLYDYASRQRMLHFMKLIDGQEDWATVSDASRTKLRESVVKMLSEEKWLRAEMWVLPLSPRVLEVDDNPDRFDFEDLGAFSDELDNVPGRDGWYYTWLFRQTLKGRKEAWLIAMLDENRAACGIDDLGEIEKRHRLTLDEALSLIASPVAEVRALGLKIRLALR